MSPCATVGKGLNFGQAYLLATRDPIYHAVADRIHSIFFLASPHRGADSAQLLSRFLSAAVFQGGKAFVNELFPGSGTLQVRQSPKYNRPNQFDSLVFFEYGTDASYRQLMTNSGMSAKICNFGLSLRVSRPKSALRLW